MLADNAIKIWIKMVFTNIWVHIKVGHKKESLISNHIEVNHKKEKFYLTFLNAKWRQMMDANIC